MSFKCEECKKTIWRTMYRVVTKKRDKIYTNDKVKYVKGEKSIQTKTSKGWEIVKEKQICGGCYEKSPQDQEKNSWKDSLNRIS